MSKTNTMDDTVTVDELDFALNNILKQLKQRGKRGERLFSMTMPEYRNAFQQAATDLGLEQEKLNPYQVRHGGPSRDALLRRRDLTEIRKRGRWVTSASVRRYEKHGRMQQALGRTPPPVMEYCKLAAANIGEWLRGPQSAVATPPGLQSKPQKSSRAVRV